MAVHSFQISNSRPIRIGAGGQTQPGGTFGKAALALTVSAAALVLAVPAFAQETQLPGINVQGAQAKKSSAPKAKAKPKPVQPAQSEPVAPPPESEGQGVAKSDVPYTTPAGISVVTSSDLSTYGGTNLDDALRSQPGTFTRTSPQNAGLAVNIRGFEGSGRVNTLIDGVPQNFSFTGHEAQGFTYIDPGLVAGIDIARGAVTTAGGAGALAGVANLRTLDVEDILRPGQNVGGFVTSTWGSNNVGFSETAAAAVQTRGIGIAGAISHRDPGSYENADGVEIPRTFQDLTSGLFKVNLRPTEEQSLRFGGVIYDNDFFANSYFQNVRSQTYTAKYAYKPIDNDLIDFRLNGYYNDVTMRYGTDSTPTTGSPVPQGSAWGRVIDDKGLGFDVSNISRFYLGGIRVKSEYGYEFFGDDVNAYNRFQPSAGGGVNPSGYMSKSAVFSETTFSKGIFDLIVGLKYDMYDINASGNATGVVLPPGVEPGPFKVDKSGGAFDPKVTLAAKVTDWLQPYITYSESQRSGTPRELFVGGNHPGSANVSFLPNPFLDPESQRGIEVGANIMRDGIFTPADSFRLKADYYHMDVEDYIAACSLGRAMYFCNVPGNSTVQGVELQGMYDAGYLFAGLSYTYTNTDLPSQTDGLGAHSYLPEHTVVASGGVRLLDRKLTLGGRVSHFSESDVGAVNVGGFYASQYMPAYTLLDFFSSYKVTENLEVGFNINNLLNEEYTGALTTAFFDGPNCYGSNLPGCNATGMGRTYFLTAKAQF
ncbi:TonB-dependent receptor domain-containing protein [Hyphomicrobium sp. 2TAF46]|uniref:TonB-dependent receptor domain-containing protein n=1 Tax=Hyphomicrobium sp. 2TAF46 TaxID=3233019 RepID=UPI003F91499C